MRMLSCLTSVLSVRISWLLFMWMNIRLMSVRQSVVSRSSLLISPMSARKQPRISMRMVWSASVPVWSQVISWSVRFHLRVRVILHLKRNCSVQSSVTRPVTWRTLHWRLILRWRVSSSTRRCLPVPSRTASRSSRIRLRLQRSMRSTRQRSATWRISWSTSWWNWPRVRLHRVWRTTLVQRLSPRAASSLPRLWGISSMVISRPATGLLMSIRMSW